jgi:NADPH-dependent 2,4-dienoyl-CoA reductase/sulfur reductase-like enzyme
MNNYRYVILGGGMVAGYAAQSFVEGGLKPGELCIMAQEAALPYERPPLSKDFLAGKAKEEEILINDEAFYSEHGITLKQSTPVAKVDFDAKQLTTDAGETIGYEKLLIATGAKLRKLDIPGAELGGVLYLRSLEDSARIREQADKAQRVVIIGGGYIGLETSSVLAQKDIPTTVIVSGEKLLARMFTPEMSDFFRSYYEERGVIFVKNAKAASLQGDGRVAGVTLDNGQKLSSDLVLAGIGVAPQTDLFEDGALQIEKGKGIVVNEFLETNLPDVYAAGDVVNYWDVIFNKQRHVEHWNNAVEGGKHVAKVMLGKREAYRQLPYFFSDEFDLSWEFWGDVDEFNRVVYRGEIESAKFSAWWLRDGVLVAAFVMDRPDEERDLAPQWIEAHQKVDAEKLQDATQPLEKSAAS